jgi:hypothetical protein
MTLKQLIDRIDHARVRCTKIFDGTPTKHKWDELMEAINELGEIRGELVHIENEGGSVE